MAKKTKVSKGTRSLFSNRYINCFIVALLLTILNHYAVYFPWILHEQDIIAESTDYKKSIRNRSKEEIKHISPERLAKDFLVIDVSNDLALYSDSSKADTLGLAVDAGSIKNAPSYAGVDTRKLTQLFKWLSENKDQYNLIVCDLLFDGLEKTKESDILLGYFLNLVQNDHQSKILFSSIYEMQNGRFTDSYFSRNLPPDIKGVVNEELTGNRFFKYKLSYEKGMVKSLPLLMLEKINSFKIAPGKFGFDKYTHINGGKMTASNVFIPEMIFTKEDFDSLKMPGNFSGASVDSSVGKMELWQTLLKFDQTDSYYLKEALRTTSAKKRNLFIGSFNHSNPDVHKTLYGDLDGGIILLNIYYNLVLHENKFDLKYNLFVFLFFCIISWLILNHPKNPWHIKYLLPRMLIDFIIEELHYILIFLLTLLSSIIFDKASNVIVLLSSIFLLSKIIKTYKTEKENTITKKLQQH